MEPKKAQVIAALRAFINQRPGLEFGNYGSVSAYRAECRQIAKDKRDALELLRAVEWRESITAEAIVEAAQGAYLERLTIAQREDGAVSVDYCAGQYFPTEYRKAACAVLASALWGSVRRSMPNPGYNPDGSREQCRYDGLRAGDWLRAHFRREFGRGIASRWFQ